MGVSYIFVAFMALDGKLVITSVATQPLISTKYLPEIYIVEKFLLSAFERRNNKLNESL